MITAERLATLTSFTAQGLTEAIRKSGYKEDKFTSCKFLGITNGGQFCYFAVYHCEGGTDSTKVFLTYNPAEDRVIAEY
jgi:hypothetical protein